VSEPPALGAVLACVVPPDELPLPPQAAVATAITRAAPPRRNLCVPLACLVRRLVAPSLIAFTHSIGNVKVCDK